VTPRDEFAQHVTADEAGSTGQQNPHVQAAAAASAAP
jgi:hypothetical protein